MPCYNKVAFISGMLDSIVAQDYDAIEVVLVDDGSTDGTSMIVANYLPLFARRGYRCQLIEQVNSGVCAAARRGLAAATGSYLCLIDADDELDPAYVGTMARWLNGHPDYDLVICAADEYHEDAGGRIYTNGPKGTALLPVDDGSGIGVVNFLLGEVIRQTVWVYMVRRSYLKDCAVQANYAVATQGSHEPGFVIPLLAHPGRRAYLPQILYHFNASGDGHSQSRSIERAQEFYDSYDWLCQRAINALPETIADAREKRFLIRVSSLSKAWHLYRRAMIFDTPAQTQSLYRSRLVESVNVAFALDPALVVDDVRGREDLLIRAFRDAALGRSEMVADGAFSRLKTEALHA
jgi:glycosyltransferase involved in cell wall biosynthesis